MKRRTEDSWSSTEEDPDLWTFPIPKKKKKTEELLDDLFPSQQQESEDITKPLDLADEDPTVFNIFTKLIILGITSTIINRRSSCRNSKKSLSSTSS